MRFLAVILYSFSVGIVVAGSYQVIDQGFPRLGPRTDRRSGPSDKVAAKASISDSRSKSQDIESASSSKPSRPKSDASATYPTTGSPRAGSKSGPSSSQSSVLRKASRSGSISLGSAAQTVQDPFSQMLLEKHKLKPGENSFMKPPIRRSQTKPRQPSVRGTNEPTHRSTRESTHQTYLDPISLANSHHGKQSALAYATGPAYMEAGVLGKTAQQKFVQPGRIGIISAHHDDKTVWATSKAGRGASTVVAAHGEGITSQGTASYAGSGWIKTVGPNNHETIQAIPSGRSEEAQWEVSDPDKHSMSTTVGIDGPGHATVGGLSKAHTSVGNPDTKRANKDSA